MINLNLKMLNRIKELIIKSQYVNITSKEDRQKIIRQT